ncbi:TrmH family RNA methyltransferase [Cesiribacter andamanensis]|uniref:tRNA (guanosine(18)-2'-O)-methyltransferase n=1 Tax=Cesiribacter andamanensis AMV16 TaxID=1279009 RepID=M7NUQ8_9BACT|nr:RNA methyltransferase [Cesiribacter andamanensis]EMR02199.1 tRNA (guanosine(18)-2'-O)-methyltransferase [Cesiribacter andamanensis AMV16]
MEPQLEQRLLQELEKMVSPNKKSLIDQVLQNRTRYLTVVLENIQKPHNASAVLRTIECLGLQEFYMIEPGKAYKANPGVVKGAIKWVDVERFGVAEADATARCIQQLRRKGYRIAVTSPHSQGYSPDELPLDAPLALFFGNEQEGLSATALAGADYHVQIPMWGFTESYNLSVSASICVYTLMQRLRASALPWRLSSSQQQALRLHWYRKLVPGADLFERQLLSSYDKRPD